MENNIDTSKRDFLKKAAYSAPVIVGLGSLTNASANGHHSCTGMFGKHTNGKYGTGNGMFGNYGKKGHHYGQNKMNMSPSTSSYKKSATVTNFKVCKTFTK